VSAPAYSATSNKFKTADFVKASSFVLFVISMKNSLV